MLKKDKTVLRDRAASFWVGGLKKNAWRKIFLLNYFLFNLFLFLQKSGGAKAPPAPPSARSLVLHLGAIRITILLTTLHTFSWNLVKRSWCSTKVRFSDWLIYSPNLFCWIEYGNCQEKLHAELKGLTPTERRVRGFLKSGPLLTKNKTKQNKNKQKNRNLTSIIHANCSTSFSPGNRGYPV